MRGFLKTEIGRVLNRLVAERRPAELVFERLDFRSPGPSRWLNRILHNAGRSIIEAKLAELADRFAVTSTEVNPAYTSQTCSACGYVDKQNRRDQKASRCRWCGHEVHADLNAAANTDARRARPNGWLFQGKAALQSRGLAELARAFGERRVRATGAGHRCGPRAHTDPGAGVPPPTHD